MKLSEYKNEDALDLLADLIEPAYVIMTDETFRDMIGTANKMQIAKYILKEHGKEIITILARLNGDGVYEANVVEILTQVIDLMNDKVLADFFVSQVQTLGGATSIPATESTEEIEKA